MIKVYIASPYTKGDVAVNVRRQIDTADTLISFGFAPYVPLLSHFQHIIHPRPYQDWTKLDLEWILSCDSVLRLDGESPGADNEVSYAISNGVPVFFSITELFEYYGVR